MNFDEAASYLNGLTRLGIKLGNERFEALLDRLGNPHRSLNAIHIAGTKGKGSTCVFAASILRSAGYKVGAYLSPFVYDLLERVQIDGEMIPRADFARLVGKIRPIADEIGRTELGPTTEFEYKTAIGFCYFAEQNVDCAVIEVGLGGRLDATNVLPDPAVSVITNIGYDHTNLLGNTLTEIAGEKAGIIKPGGICVTGAQEPEAFLRIEQVARERGAALIHVAPGRSWGASDDGLLWIKTEKREVSHLKLGLQGSFQLANAALAVHALDHARGIDVSDAAVRSGLAATHLPGRMEIVRDDNPRIVVDAAHNQMAARALSEALKEEFAADRHPLVLVVGMSKGHEPAEFLEPLLSGFDPARVILFATEPHFRPREAAEVAEAARKLGIAQLHVAASVAEAAAHAVDTALDLGPDALVLVTGSFYTIGELAPEKWQEIFEARDLNTRIPRNIWETKPKVNI